MNKLVSVNLTTFNRAHLLPRALDSILAQTYKALEIIIVDDCSSDNTIDLVKSYQKRDKRIIYYRHDINKGLSYARNTAFKNCTGYYVAFMDDDDEWIDNDKIKKQVEIFENCNEKIGIVCSSVRLYADENNFNDRIIERPKNIVSHILSRNGIIYTPTVMTKRKIIEEVGGFDTNLIRGVDSDFYRICIIKYLYDVYFMKDITTTIYEFGDDRITIAYNKAKIKKIIKNQLYVILKYFSYFIKYPTSLFNRLFKITKFIFKLLK